ncbi:siderophore iron transporter mirB [Cordyceps fumosorosea ARSEF 2679]|uniref:Siderophore iron transporter mirB n=1 Tax=Cordyceps fumosorosea (strain ARSEF 2679) TaxID=1081104 RepID=A0A162IES7_CORFA|nr:siderophore iron transporter mirB [Cordyceps fumosorosea ARSEF 2679]OAA56115.1 siderophore iron transporter mirB [Cordyceps fumosorosea ARSEF 2679]
MQRGSGSRSLHPSPQQKGTTAATSDDVHAHLLSNAAPISHDDNSASSSSNKNRMSAPRASAAEPGYGTVKQGDVERAKPSSDEDIRELQDDGPASETSSVHVQDGVKRVEAITMVWSKNTMIVMFILLYLVSFVDTLLQSVQGALTPYVTSNFKVHGLLGVTDILAFILGGVCNLAIAKVIDIWGRAEGFAVMIVFIIVGMIMKAACINVEMFAAANTIYWVGHIGMQYCIQIIYADMTTMRNRMLLFGLLQLPTIAATFGGPQIAQLFYEHSNFRWAFGAFTIIMPVFAAPVMVVFWWSQRKARREGKLPERVKTRTALESIKYYAIEFDVVGMFLTIFGWVLLLLPFSLVNYAPQGWKSGYIIAMIVVGVVLLAAFVFWEKYFATVHYFPFKHLKDRSILGACLLYGIMFLSIFTWDTYYYSYLQVVNNLSISNASYVLNAFSLMGAITGPLTGVLIRYHGYYKWPSIAMTPFAVLGTALLVYFRTPSSHVGYLVMCQLFNGIYSGVWAATSQLSVMANVTHQETAVAIALYSLFGSIGAAIGQAIAGGLWTNILPKQLYQNLPDELKANATDIYADLTVQLSFPLGSPARDAIILSYGHVQRLMVIVGCCFLPLCLACLFMWKNLNVKDMESKERRKKGNVF